MDNLVKLMPKSKSTHELLSQQNSLICSATGTNLHGMITPTSGHTQFLPVPSPVGSFSSKNSCSVSESSECSALSDSSVASCDLPKDQARKLKKYKKSIRKQRKKNEKQLQELIQFLHVGQQPPLATTLDEEDLQYLSDSKNSANSCLNKSLNDYLQPPDLKNGNSRRRILGVSKSLDSYSKCPLLAKTRYITESDGEDEDADYSEQNEKTITNAISNQDTITASGFRRIRRFGYDVEDGCGFPLSMRREDASQLEHNGPKPSTQILQQANESMGKQTNSSKRIAINQLYEVYPCPEIEFVSLAGGVLPFRRWNSELRLNVKMQQQNQEPNQQKPANQKKVGIDKEDSACSSCSGSLTSPKMRNKRNSCEDLRHLTATGSFSTFERELLQQRFKMIDNQQAGLMMRKTTSNGSGVTESGCCSSDFSSEHSICSCASSISGISTMIGLDMKQMEMNSLDVFLRYFEPRLVAIELTKLEIELFLQLNCTEISREIFSPTRKLNVTQFFEVQCIYFFVQLILCESELDGRVNCLKQCIELLIELHRLRNWQSFNSVLIALHCIPIVRLKRTWAKLQNQWPKIYASFCELTEKNHVNHDHYLLHNHAHPSIPCLSELLNEIRARIAFKINQLDYKRRPTVFGKPENLTDWLTSEVRNLQSLLVENKQLNEHELLEKSMRKEKKSNIFKKVLKSFAFKNSKKQNDSLPLSTSSVSMESAEKPDDSLNTLPSAFPEEERVDDELILMKTINSNYRLDEWRQIQMDLKLKLGKLKPEMESSILNEINKCLQLHQRLVYNYNFDCNEENCVQQLCDQIRCSNESKINSIVKRCLVQITKLNANSMQENMKRSLQIEPLEEEKIESV